MGRAGDDVAKINRLRGVAFPEKKNRRGALFYRERRSGDYLFVWRHPDYPAEWNNTATATAVAGDPSSLCWTTVSYEYLLSRCRRVTRREVTDALVEEPGWETLLVRADWMCSEMVRKGEAVLPY